MTKIKSIDTKAYKVEMAENIKGHFKVSVTNHQTKLTHVFLRKDYVLADLLFNHHVESFNGLEGMH